MVGSGSSEKKYAVTHKVGKEIRGHQFCGFNALFNAAQANTAANMANFSILHNATIELPFVFPKPA